MRAFISYSHRDSTALERLHVHLANLRREGQVDAWYDREIMPGAIIDEEIERELELADIFLLLVSPDFIASDYCVQRELTRALERHDAGEALVVPIILEPCDWAAMPSLRRLRAVPDDGIAISEWTNPNTAYLNVIQELRRLVSSLENKHTEECSPSPQIDTLPAKQSSYRIKKDFDEIDLSEFRQMSFASIREYFRKAVVEIDTIDGMRAKYSDYGSSSFGSTIINSLRQRGTAHITVHMRNSGFSLGEIYYSFQDNSEPNSANGALNIESDDYDLFLVEVLSMNNSGKNRMTPEQAAVHIWNQFIRNAGIEYA